MIRFFLFALVCASQVTYAQQDERINIIEDTSQAGRTLLTGPNDKMPEPGYDVIAFMSKTMRYPVKAKKNNITGRVVVYFIVTESGEITDVKVRKPVHELLDKEAIRVVSKMPPWQPAVENGKPVRVYYMIPINFKIDKATRQKKN